jgi:hypothetical protein
MSEKQVGAQVRVDLAGYDTGNGRIGAGMSVGGTITLMEGSEITVRLRAPVDGSSELCRCPSMTARAATSGIRANEEFTLP